MFLEKTVLKLKQANRKESDRIWQPVFARFNF